MSTSLGSAFNTLLSIHSRTVTIERPGVFAATEIKVSPSNYSRNLAGPEGMAIKGREYVVTKYCLDKASLPRPKRGDRLVDAELGVDVINEVRELFGFGGHLLGYRVRTG